MRIIGGEARSRALVAPKGMDTRPTLDQVRESVFNILRLRVENARVLDLYAGSGALALEALSRGAKEAVLADCSREAQGCIRRNIEALQYQERARLMPMDAMRALDKLAAEQAPFDLVFLDPPYRLDSAPAMKTIVERGLLKEDGLMIVEHARKSPPTGCEELLLEDQRNYRDTAVSFFRRKQDGANEVSVSGQL